MDKNTVSYMVDELKAQLAKQKAEKDTVIFELSQKDAELSRKDAEIQYLREELARLGKLMI